MPPAPKIIPKPNERFGLWTVLGPPKKQHNGRVRYYFCRCDCGTERDVNIQQLKKRKYCSYARHEVGNTVHGHTRVKGEDGRSIRNKQTVEYMAWRGMKRRCYDPNSTGYKNWGGRGITVCPRWLNSFENFLQNMGKRPAPGYTLERKNNSLNYTPKNCEWATRRKQSNNTRTNRILTYNGKSLTVADWARETGISYVVLSSRVRYGWSNERILTEPVHPSHRG